MNNGDVFKMQPRLQGGEAVLLGDGTQISVHLVVSHLFFYFTTSPFCHPAIPPPLASMRSYHLYLVTTLHL